MDKYTCSCGIMLECPVKKRKMKIRHSVYSHYLVKEIYLYERYSKCYNVINLDLLRRTIVENKDIIKKMLWTVVYTENNFMENKQKCIDILTADIPKNNHIVSLWKEWYLNESSEFYGLTKNTYPQIGRVLFTNNAI
tara:strand:+ start:2000 stop:2410 length:411 start_codon:yes stop_codon:yes gene_type:complete